MVSKNNTKQSVKVLQDWTDYDKSVVNSISSEYYAKKGVDAFDSQATNSNSIPNTVSNSYPHALSIVRMLKANLDELDSSSKIRVLECGAGAGLFARHFLLAAQEEGILQRLEYFLSDIAAHSLRQIQEKGILEEFQDLGVFRLVTLFLPNFDSVFDLEGNQIELDSLDLVIANYVVDSLPMIPLKKKEGGCFDKLQLKISQNQFIQNQNLISDLGFLSRLNITERWVNYDLAQASEMEKNIFTF
jgi:SAM-dependent methyltransferase